MADRIVEPPPRGWPLDEARRRVAEPELRDAFATGRMVLSGYQPDGLGALEPTPTVAEPHWAAAADFYDDAAHGPGRYLMRARVFPAPATEPMPAVMPEAKKQGKNMSATLEIAADAIGATLHLEGETWKSDRAFARRACEVAQELDIEGADSLNPESPSIRDLAGAIRHGIRRGQAVEDEKMTRPKPSKTVRLVTK